MEKIKDKKMQSKVKKYSIIVVVFIFVIAIIYTGIKLKSGQNRQIISETIQEKVEKLVELASVRYNYTDVVDYKESLQLSGMDIPLTQKKFIIKYEGYLKAGVDLTSIEVDIKNEGTIEISMNKALVLDNVINEEDVTFFDERDGLFNKLSFKDLYAVLVGQKEKVEKDALDRGFLNQAEDNAEEILLSLLREMGYKNIIIKFK